MLDNLKALLGLPEEDISQDKKLQLILTAAKSRLKLLLGGIEPPEETELYHSGCCNHTIQQNWIRRAFFSQC